MASKGQKFNKYSEETIDIILEKLKIGKSSIQLSKEYNIPAKTIRTWKRKKLFILNYLLIKDVNVVVPKKKI